MNYHINTILIWESFECNDGCPMCRIQAEIEKGLISQYLNEAVMVDDCRAQVNKYGFCAEHFKKLYGGSNKLGLALQTHTRLNTLAKSLKSAKSPKSLADLLKKELSGCVICQITDMHIEKYCQSIAKIYGEDAHFREIFDKSCGFCLPHYQILLSEGGNKQYAAALINLQNGVIDNISGDLKFFTEKYDANNADKPWGNKKEALKKSLNILCGKIID